MLERLKRFADRGWYPPLVAFLAGADQFIIVVPIEWLIIPHVLLRPKRWLVTALVVTTGCALGALALAYMADAYGPGLIARWAPNVIHSRNWARSVSYLNDNGALALMVIAASPLPQQPAVALAGLSHMPLPKIFAAVWVGRAAKYCLVAYLCSHAPRLLTRIFPKTRILFEKEIPSHEIR